MSRNVVAWLTLTVAAFAVLLAWVLPDMSVHRGQIYAVGTEGVVCTGGHPRTGRAQVLHHLADCAGDNTEVRRELRAGPSARGRAPRSCVVRPGGSRVWR